MSCKETYLHIALGSGKLVLLWAWGHISPQMVQHTMHLCREDLRAHDANRLNTRMIDRLAELGTSGLYPNNINRQLCDAIPRPNMPAPHSFRVPLRHSTIGLFFSLMDMILPHELFAAIYHYYPKCWREHICPSEARVHKNWRSMQGGAAYKT